MKHKKITLQLVKYIKETRELENKLYNIGWDVQIPSNTADTPSLEDLVLDLMGIPCEQTSNFIRDLYYDVFCQNVSAEEMFDLLIEQAEENRSEYLSENCKLPNYENW